MDNGLSRRELLLILSAAGFTALQLPAAEPGRPLFFTSDEFALLDELTDLLVPSDEHSPGAREAGVAAYIDRSVAEAFLPENKSSWRDGLHSIEELSNSLNGLSFLKLPKQDRIALLAKIAAAEHDPHSEAEKFFTQLKQTTAFVYYSSSIGIHQDVNYKGNVILEQFVGYDAS